MGVGGGVPTAGARATGGGVAGRAGFVERFPSAASQLGIRGVSPRWPPFALDVPIQRTTPGLRVRSAASAALLSNGPPSLFQVSSNRS